MLSNLHERGDKKMPFQKINCSCFFSRLTLPPENAPRLPLGLSHSLSRNRDSLTAKQYIGCPSISNPFRCFFPIVPLPVPIPCTRRETYFQILIDRERLTSSLSSPQGLPTPERPAVPYPSPSISFHLLHRAIAPLDNRDSRPGRRTLEPRSTQDAEA